ncbi:MAG: DUF5683 domain-containing protein [Candidatus Longimicrobiales bacterium M2_2A_002]
MTRSAPLPAFLLALAMAAGAGPSGPAGLTAQEPDSLRVDSVRPVPRVLVVPDADSVQPAVTPRSAMFRSFLLPGWGQAEYDAYFRGGIYFAGWAANWFMNFRNAVRLNNARDRLRVRTNQIEARILARSPDPDSLQAVLDSFPGILADSVSADALGSDLQGLVESREQQREDWIAWSIFWVLASGIDAYVTGHLADFPAEIEIRPNPDRSVSLGVGVPWPARRTRVPAAPAVAAPGPPRRDE